VSRKLKARKKSASGEDESSFDRAAVAAMTPEERMALSWRITKDLVTATGDRWSCQSDWIALLREFYAAGVEYIGDRRCGDRPIMDTRERLATSMSGFVQLRRTLDSSFAL